MENLKWILFILLSLTLAGCAKYSQIALEPDVYKVSYRGHPFASSEDVEDYVLRRCAKLTIKKGYNYFLIMAENASNEGGYYTTPATMHTNSAGNYWYNGNFYSQTNATIYPASTVRIDKYRAAVIIKLLKSNKNFPGAINAETILNSR